MILVRLREERGPRGHRQFERRRVDVAKRRAFACEHVERPEGGRAHLIIELRIVHVEASQHAKAEAARARLEPAEIVLHRGAPRGCVVGIGAGDGLEDNGAVPHAAGHRPDVVERPAHRQHAAPAHQTVRWLVADEAGHRCGPTDGAAGVRAERAGTETCGRGNGRARRRARRRAAHVPRIATGGKRALRCRTAERPLVHRELTEDHRARVVQPSRDEGVARRHVVGEELRAARHPHAGDGDQVLQRNRHAVERTAAPAPLAFGVGGLCARQRLIGHHRDVRAQHAVVPLDPAEILLGRLDGRHVTPRERVAHAAQIEIGDGYRHGSSSGVGTSARRRSRCGSQSTHMS